MKVYKETKKCVDGKELSRLWFYDIGLKREILLTLDRWNWNGDIEKPTINPSVLSTDGMGNISHLFIRDGKLIYLSDCTHELKGKTVDMLDWEVDTDFIDTGDW